MFYFSRLNLHYRWGNSDHYTIMPVRYNGYNHDGLNPWNRRYMLTVVTTLLIYFSYHLYLIGRSNLNKKWIIFVLASMHCISSTGAASGSAFVNFSRSSWSDHLFLSCVCLFLLFFLSCFLHGHRIVTSLLFVSFILILYLIYLDLSVISSVKFLWCLYGVTRALLPTNLCSKYKLHALGIALSMHTLHKAWLCR